MIISNDQDTSVEVVTDGTATTTELKCTASYTDVPSANFQTGVSLKATTGATPMTLVEGVADTFRREVKYISVFNSDTVSHVVTIQMNDGTDVWILFKVTLPVGYSIIYNEGSGWDVFTTTGAISMETTTISSIEIGDSVIGGTIQAYLLTDDDGNLASGVWKQTGTTLTLPDGYSINSASLAKAQIDFGPAGDVITLSPDSGILAVGYGIISGDEATIGWGSKTFISSEETSVTMLADLPTGSQGLWSVTTSASFGTLTPVRYGVITENIMALKHDVKILLDSAIIQMPTSAQLISGTANKSEINFGATDDEFNWDSHGGDQSEAYISATKTSFQYYNQVGNLFINTSFIKLIHPAQIEIDTDFTGFVGIGDNNSGSIIIGNGSSLTSVYGETQFNGRLLMIAGNEIDTPATGGTDTLNLGTTNADVINYGNSATVHNFLGTAIYELQVNSYLTDKLMTLNYGGAAASGIGVGFEIQENSLITGCLKTNAARSGWSFKAPANTDYTDLVFTASTPRTKTFQDTTSTIAEYGNKLSVFSATTSAELAGVISDETGTGVLVYNTSPVLITPNLGTPTTIVLTNATGLPIGGITGLGSGIATFLATPTSANLAGALTDETGTGVVVYNTSPTLITPVLGVASATELDITGIGGNGFIQLVAQASNPAAPAVAGFRLFAGSTGSFNWVRKNGSDTFVRTFDATLTADRTYTLQNIASTIAMYSNKLNVFASTTSAELAGIISDETGSGPLVFSISPTFQTTVLINNPANTFAYTVTPAAILAARILNLPLTTQTETLAVKPSLSQNQTSPTGTTSATEVMAGIALAFTPVVTGRVMIIVTGDCNNSASGSGVGIQAVFGTGTAPINGAAVTGTHVGTVRREISSAAARIQPYAIAYTVSGLTIGTAYWFDLGFFAITSGTGTLNRVDYLVIEI